MVARRAEVLHKEDAATVLAAAALDVDAVATRTVTKLRRLEAGGAEAKLIRATRHAAESLFQVAKVLRRDGLLGPDYETDGRGTDEP